MLSEQIAAQTEKMTDLERALQDARQRLDDAEQRLQKVKKNVIFQLKQKALVASSRILGHVENTRLTTK